MAVRFVVTGTDTDVGKTVFAAGLTRALGALYWKPIQSGLDGETDSQAVQRLAGLPPERIIPEAYRLHMPASPHIAAERDGVTIAAERLTPPQRDEQLVIEAAGGLMVPLTEQCLFIDVFARWRIPVILIARTRLGTINHTLLSLEALRSRTIPIHGVAFVGDADPPVERTIGRIGAVRVLGRLPRLDPCNAQTLASAFSAAFPSEAFAA